jgi:YggT family protein
VTSWAVRRGALTPFGWWPRFVRRWSDPLLRPVERRLHRAGGNPQDAPLWFLGGVVLLSLLLLAAAGWVADWLARLAGMRSAGTREWLRLAISSAASLLTIAIFVRVIASWFGAGRYSRWLRPFYFLTDWLIEPIRRRLPSFGLIDLSPLLAYVLVLIARSILLGLI